MLSDYADMGGPIYT